MLPLPETSRQRLVRELCEKARGRRWQWVVHRRATEAVARAFDVARAVNPARLATTTVRQLESRDLAAANGAGTGGIVYTANNNCIATLWGLCSGLC